MSGIAAIIRFDGGAVEPGQIEAMTAAMHYRGVDGITHWQRGGVALGHCMLHTTAESLEESQPLANDDESLILVMDGWLSNWEELRSELLTRGARLRTRSDAELVLRAYEQWGEDCPKHIDGEFAFLIWDARRREVFLARDHAGLRPLHYHWDGRRLVVASDVAGVLAFPDVEARPNRGMMAEFMACEWYSRSETIWQGIMRPLSAHWMRFGTEGASSGQYWSPPAEVSITYSREEEYFEHYRAMFADCVRRASRSHLPIACDVSGGLDSSAVFAMAHHLRSSARLQAPGVQGFTYRFSESGSPADELAYARAVAQHVGAEVREIPPFMPELSWFAQRGKADRDLPPYPNAAMAVAIGETLCADGMRVALNGEGGDEWLYGSRFYYAEQLRAMDRGSLFTSIRADIAEAGLGNSAWWIARFGLAPLLPQPMKDWLRRQRGRFKADTSGSAYYWLSPELGGLLAQRRAAFDYGSARRVANLARRGMLMTLEDPYMGLVRDAIARQCAWIGYDVRYPMYARSFIEFAFSTPESLRLRGKTKKYIHVKAMAGLLPDVVTSRKTKAAFIQTVTRQVDTMRDLLVATLPKNGSGNLDSNGMARLYDCYLRSGHDNIAAWQLWGAFGCENVLQVD